MWSNDATLKHRSGSPLLNATAAGLGALVAAAQFWGCSTAGCRSPRGRKWRRRRSLPAGAARYGLRSRAFASMAPEASFSTSPRPGSTAASSPQGCVVQKRSSAGPLSPTRKLL